MLENLEGKEFPAVFEMMKNSFPQEEYRTYFGQKALLEKPGYTIYVKRGQEKQIQGFAAVWQWENLSFIEHLAVAPQYRNQGIGGEILKELAGKSVTKEEFTEIKNRLYHDVYGIPPCPAQD